MVNTCESLINVVIGEQAKDADACRRTDKGLDQNGTRPSSGAPNSPDADVAPPAERRDLTHSGTHAERGKPVVLPSEISPASGEAEPRESKPQGKPKGLRGWDDGESECRSVVERIEVALVQHHLTRKRADFHLVSHHERV
jgi:hypothetical protein